MEAKLDMEEIINVSNLVKVYNKKIKAVDDISFSVKEGEIFGLLGPNGAGKTTILKILATLIQPTAGSVKILDYDIIKDEQNIRDIIGYVPQDLSADSALTGYENLLISAKLYDIKKEEREDRINKLLEMMGLNEARNRLVKTYSGGMIRKLEVAQVMVHDPQIVYLDEPTVGLDPKSRKMIWDQIEEIRKMYNTTFILTTHYMDEADVMCDRVGIINGGKIMVIGSPDSLKKSIGDNFLKISLSEPVHELEISGAVVNGSEIEIPVKNVDYDVPLILKKLYDQNVHIESMHTRENTLDDVFLMYTGGRIEESHQWRDTKNVRRIARRLA
ncbi:MAG: ATP-binding cassette domain-containing protein [Thermoplasmata archaeon]